MPVLSAAVDGVKNGSTGSGSESAILFDGAGLNVDHASYVAQHDVVYHSPPLGGEQAMPLGDGDLGAMLWCPSALTIQLQKSDLWADPVTASQLPEDWKQLSAGTISLRTDPSFLDEPSCFEQRLVLNSGVVTIHSDTPQGSCQITAFVSATAGVLVVHYRDQTSRGASRNIELSLSREAHVFAAKDTVGILQAFQDRRYALLARVTGAPVAARLQNAHRSSLSIEAGRSSEFTLIVAVATSPRNGDPVAAANARIEAAVTKGFRRLLIEQRQHWSIFWQKSFLRLKGAGDDPLPNYLENLWYLAQYQLASSSRGSDAPLANGGLWLSDGDSRSGPALYQGSDLRWALAALIPSNRIELTVPYIDTCCRLLPDLAARTASEFGLSGARFPFCFNRFGVEFPESASASEDPSAHRLTLGDGLDTGLLIWEIWRHTPDPFLLRERAYPLLRATTGFALEYCQTVPQLWYDSTIRAKIRAALQALLWADREYTIEDTMADEWRQALDALDGDPIDLCASALSPFDPIHPATTIPHLASLLVSSYQAPSGLFGSQPHSPDLGITAQLCAALNSVLLEERSLPSDAGAPLAGEPSSIGFRGVPARAIQVFAGLPLAWSAAFSLAAPGGFRVSAEASEGKPRYVAIKSLLGGVCRIANPWGNGERARIWQGDTHVVDSTAPILEFMTQPHLSYFIERGDLSRSRRVSSRLGGKPNPGPKRCGPFLLGLPAAVQTPFENQGETRLRGQHAEAAAVVTPLSRIERARSTKRGANAAP